MNRSSWTLISLATLFITITPSQLAYSQDDVGYIEKIRGKDCWKQKADDPESRLKPKQAVGQKLFPGEKFRCGGQCSLVLMIRGKRVTVDENKGWFSIAFALPPGRDPKKETETESGTGAGRVAVNSLSFSEGASSRIFGVVSLRTGDSFKVRDPGGAEMTVLLTASTKVSSHSRGLKGKQSYPVTYIMRGLRLQAEGKGDANGNLVADWVRFDEQDLRSAQALEQTDELAQENLAKIKETEENARRMLEQIQENTALANDARARADEAQLQADAAYKAAALANNRINGLDDYDAIRTIPVLFKLNSNVLNATAKQAIDEAAGWAAAEKAKGNANGWLVEIVGFADTTGKSAKNRALSERRAKAVINYLVTVHNLDLRRVVQPFGYGDQKPVAGNKTAAGRAKNRRVEIRILQNKSIANTVS